MSTESSDRAGRDINKKEGGVHFAGTAVLSGPVVGGDVGQIVYTGLSREEVLELVDSLKSSEQPQVWDGRIPYPGLNAFQESDAQFFFGRKELIDDLLSRIARARFITISGPSGSGKSSVARAGLFHALRQGQLERSDKWLLATMQPKDDPLEQLALAVDRLAGKPGAADIIREKGLDDPGALHKLAETMLTDDKRQRFVLLVDQFEEIFTGIRDEGQREAFIALLTTAAQMEAGRVTIVIALRSDFVSNCARYSDLRKLLSQEFQLVGAMAPRDLAQAITLPALEVGASIDPALVKQIIDDMKGEPGALPLMSFALRVLFEAEKTEKGAVMDLTLEEYLARGGIDRALERHADQVFKSLTREQQHLARGIFSKLITVGEGRVDTRRTAVFEELMPAGMDESAVSAVVEQLSAEGVRLVTTSSETSDAGFTAEEMRASPRTVTIAHEKLIDAWPWLRRLVDENRAIIALQNEINSRARGWAREEDPGYLYRGGLLLRVQENWDALQPNLDQLSLSFVEASIKAREAEELKEAQRIRNEEALRLETANKDRFRRLTIGLAVVAVIAVIASLVALFFMNTARSQANLAATSEAQAVVARATSDANAQVAATQEAEARAAQVEIADLKNRIQASQLAAASEVALDQDQELALLLATTGLGLSSQPDTLTRFYSAVSQPFRHTLRGHFAGFTTAVFSPDGTKILTSGWDGNTRVWDAADNELLALMEHADGINSAAFNPDGTRIVTANSDSSAQVWDLEGHVLTTLEGPIDGIGSAIFSPDGTKILSTSWDGSAQVWDVDGQELATLGGPDDWISSAAFSPDGMQIVTAGSDGSARLWDLEGHELATFEGQTDGVNSAVFSLDGTRIATASRDGSVRVWDVAGHELAILEGHEDEVISVVFSPDGTRILSTSWDGSARLWDVVGNELATLEGHSDQVSSAEFSPDGTRIVTASRDGSARIWDAAGHELDVLKGHIGVVLSAEFSPDGTRVVTAGAEDGAKVWDLAGLELATLEANKDAVLSADYSPDGTRIVTAGPGASARVWDTAGNELATLEGHTDVVNSAVFSPDGTRIVTASWDGSVRLWDVAGNELAILVGHNDRVNSVVFSPDGTQIATVGWDGSARLWDLEGHELAAIEGRNDPVLSAVFSPDGLLIITVDLRVRDMAGNELAILEGHTGGIKSAVFSPDWTRIVTASDDGSARLWDLAGSEVASLEGHTGGVNSAVFSPDGMQVLTAGEDGRVKIWAIYPSIAEKVAVARERLSTAFTDGQCRQFFPPDEQDLCPRDLEQLFTLFEDDDH